MKAGSGEIAAHGVKTERAGKGKGFDWEWTPEQQTWMKECSQKNISLQVPERKKFLDSKAKELVRKWDFKVTGDAVKVSVSPFALGSLLTT